MSRTDDDAWDITESVGTTALAIAAARAAETDSDNPLIVDPFARLLVEASGDRTWTAFFDGTVPEEIADVDPELPVRMRSGVDYISSRTKYFDDFFLAAADDGVRQAVILGAGLDTRAWRLPWPDGARVYELDQPKVLNFKGSTLAGSGAEPPAVLVPVPVDLRQDWPKALDQAGYDASARTAWSVEGLLPFLPAQAQDLLFDRVQALSAAGSRVAIEAFGGDLVNSDSLRRQRAQMERYRVAAADIPKVEDLWYLEERADVADWLGRHGWDVTVITAQQLMADNHRSVPDHLGDAVPQSQFVTARR
ncbi:SAM-dependent methyltransferase [Mycolicibacter kumamotonensis]|uniref:S-adenosyl-L-methionine-dependent methyltransferase n=1 Tax=Mycolicibacter kumamotonensis TaxID=354243 RepID=A0A1B8S955_9MYCO|nr:SAM-dependent methyltransferase [Mycolicibacter kumamotonensis]OBY29273.1 SAM-dependent methyltransferase [Mycolicibacter kumamotonensis]